MIVDILNCSESMWSAQSGFSNLARLPRPVPRYAEVGSVLFILASLETIVAAGGFWLLPKDRKPLAARCQILWLPMLIMHMLDMQLFCIDAFRVQEHDSISFRLIQG